MPLLSLDRINQWVPLDFMLKTDKMKLPLHEFSFVKATAPLLAATAAVNAALTTIIRVDINQTYHNFPKTLAISIWISYNTIDNLTDGSLCYRLRGRYNLRPIT